MSRKVRRRGRKLARKKRGNWFTRMRIWQKVLVCFFGVFVCLLATAVTYVAAKWSKVDTQKIEAKDLIIKMCIRDRLCTGTDGNHGRQLCLSAYDVLQKIGRAHV